MHLKTSQQLVANTAGGKDQPCRLDRLARQHQVRRGADSPAASAATADMRPRMGLTIARRQASRPPPSGDGPRGPRGLSPLWRYKGLWCKFTAWTSALLYEFQDFKPRAYMCAD